MHLVYFGSIIIKLIIQVLTSTLTPLIVYSFICGSFLIKFLKLHPIHKDINVKKNRVIFGCFSLSTALISLVAPQAFADGDSSSYQTNIAPSIYVKPGYTATWLSDTSFTETNPSGGRIAIGFKKPILPTFAWGVEGGYGYYGKKTNRGHSSLNINNNLVTTTIDNDYTVLKQQGFDVDALLWWNFSRFSFFGKIGVMDEMLQTKTVVNNSITVLNSDNQSITNYTAATSSSLTKTTQINVLGGLGVDYMISPHVGLGCEYNYVNGNSSALPINIFQLYARLVY